MSSHFGFVKTFCLVFITIMYFMRVKTCFIVNVTIRFYVRVRVGLGILLLGLGLRPGV